MDNPQLEALKLKHQQARADLEETEELQITLLEQRQQQRRAQRVQHDELDRESGLKRLQTKLQGGIITPEQYQKQIEGFDHAIHVQRQDFLLEEKRELDILKQTQQQKRDQILLAEEQESALLLLQQRQQQRRQGQLH